MASILADIAASMVSALNPIIAKVNENKRSIVGFNLTSTATYSMNGTKYNFDWNSKQYDYNGKVSRTSSGTYEVSEDGWYRIHYNGWFRNQSGAVSADMVVRLKVNGTNDQRGFTVTNYLESDTDRGTLEKEFIIDLEDGDELNFEIQRYTPGDTATVWFYAGSQLIIEKLP